MSAMVPPTSPAQSKHRLSREFELARLDFRIVKRMTRNHYDAPQFLRFGGTQEASMISEKIPAHEEDSRETPVDDPRQKTDWPNTKQTDEPWNGPVEKEQR